MLSPSGDDECIKEAIQQIENHVTSVVQDPSYEIPKNVFRLRQAQFKVRKTLLPHSRSFNSNILLPMSFRISTMQSGGSGATKIATTMIFQLKKEDGELYLSPRYSPKFTVQLVHPSIWLNDRDNTPVIKGNVASPVIFIRGRKVLGSQQWMRPGSGDVTLTDVLFVNRRKFYDSTTMSASSTS